MDHIYFDASALAKLVLNKEGDADVAAALRARARAIYTSWLSYPEVRSAIARAQRSERLTEAELHDAWDTLDELWQTFIPIAVSPAITRLAGALVSRYPLSGADAVHLASALIVRIDQPIIFASWDTRQIEAAEALGLLLKPPRRSG